MDTSPQQKHRHTDELRASSRGAMLCVWAKLLAAVSRSLHGTSNPARLRREVRRFDGPSWRIALSIVSWITSITIDRVILGKSAAAKLRAWLTETSMAQRNHETLRLIARAPALWAAP